jgi:predicted glutamine amidotransferase
MCRLFGFRSVINSQVHSSLVSADNALMEQSNRHPDGWGVAYYLENTPHVVKSIDCAMDDHLFKRVSGVVASHTVVAHIRKATHGDHSILNSHPFQYGKWIFAHNGNIKKFDQHRDELLKLIDPNLMRYLLGTTDSEVIFLILLTIIKQNHDLSNTNVDVDYLFDCIEKATKMICNIIGTLNNSNKAIPTENYLSMIITTGPVLAAFQGGQHFYYCTYKKKCPERDFCPHFASSCEAPPENDNKVNHLIIASEQLAGENVWKPMQAGQLVGVDNNMQLHLKKSQIQFVS